MVQMIFFLLSLVCFAEEQAYIYEIGSSLITFVKTEQLVVNKTCGTTCLAYKKGRSAESIKVDPKDLMGGKNPSSVKCSKHLGGKVVIGRDDEENQQSFCLFTDGSYLKN